MMDINGKRSDFRRATICVPPSALTRESKDTSNSLYTSPLRHRFSPWGQLSPDENDANQNQSMNSLKVSSDNTPHSLNVEPIKHPDPFLERRTLDRRRQSTGSFHSDRMAPYLPLSHPNDVKNSSPLSGRQHDLSGTFPQDKSKIPFAESNSQLSRKPSLFSNLSAAFFGRRTKEYARDDSIMGWNAHRPSSSIEETHLGPVQSSSSQSNTRENGPFLAPVRSSSPRPMSPMGTLLLRTEF